jgi:glycosyltransferase involved in cell wall biosynthesis
MRALDGAGIVVYRASAGVDAIDEYSRRLVQALRATGEDTRYVADGLASVRRSTGQPPWVLLQYNPFGYGRWGVAPGLVRDAIALRRRTGMPLGVMVHEAWVDMADWRSTVMGAWQRLQLRSLLRFADVVMTSTQALARELGRGAIHVPVATTITPIATTTRSARDRLGLADELVVALLGRANPSRALDYAAAAIAAIAEARGARALTVLNLGADAPPLEVEPAVDVRTPGRLEAGELSLRLSASDVVLLPFTDGVSTRRTTLMAALAHGRPVVGLHGHNTDEVLVDHPEALTLTPVGDPGAFARAAVALASDPDRLDAAGAAGRRLYAEQFDWPVLAQRVLSALGTTTTYRVPALAA